MHLKKLNDTLQKHPNATLAFLSVQPGFEPQFQEIMQPYHIPYIFVTKIPLPDVEQYGAIGNLIKPISIQKLKDMLNTALLEKETGHIAHANKDNIKEQIKHLQPHILIAEDNPVNRMLLHSQLSSVGATIVQVEDGEQAQKIAMTERFHAIFLDLQMPKLSGLDAASLIKKESVLNKQTPIIIITANSDDVKQQKRQKSGIDACLPKPVDEQILFKTLLALLRKKQKNAIDWMMCVQKMSGNQALAEEYLHSFIQELMLNKDSFIQLLKKKDKEATEKEAHRLLGACCYCGVPRLQSQVMLVENLSKSSAEFSKIRPELIELIQCIDEVIQAYETSYLTHEES
jgi:two-component system sensor histidine kinase BarA